MPGPATLPDAVVTAPDATQPSSRPDSEFAQLLRGFGPVGLIAIVVIYFGNALFGSFSAVLVLIWAYVSRTPWREIGFARPGSWTATILGGILFGAGLKLLMKAVVMPMLGAPAINQAFHHLAGNTAALPAALFAMIVVAGFGEETVFRGFAFERLGKLMGSGAAANAAIVLLTSAWFGLEHYSLQGLPGVQQATIVGLLFGAIMAATGNLWFLIVAHAAFDVTALAIIYWDIEWEVAHLVF
jgi:membrane protease YdiL (CAAX protease family)